MKEYKYTINGKKYEVTIGEITEDAATVTVNGEEYKVAIEPEQVEPKVVVTPPKPAAPSAAQIEAQNERQAAIARLRRSVVAPLPGTIVGVNVKVGDEVKSGDVVVTLEAMKMDNRLETELTGTVTEVCCEPGQSVMEGDVLVVIG